MHPTLVILAAGMGARFSGPKQTTPVGPDGSTLTDYLIYDAVRAGFGRVVFVIRPDMAESFAAQFCRRLARHVAVSCVCQRITDVPPGFAVPQQRVKPWGTGQALLAAENEIQGPFAVANADDWYGPQACAGLGAFLRDSAEQTSPTWALVGYRLRDTLSASGAVSRAVCHCTPDGWLEQITEFTGIELCDERVRRRDEAGHEHVLTGDERVSMNLWGFTPAVFAHLRAAFDRFLIERGTSSTAEFYLPAAIQAAIASRRARVRVLPSGGMWCGLTHPQDRQRVANFIARAVDEGTYPRTLWT